MLLVVVMVMIALVMTRMVMLVMVEVNAVPTGGRMDWQLALPQELQDEERPY